MFELIVIGVGAVATIGGYIKSRQFVRHRLRFVDAIQKPVAPLAAGVVAALAAGPVVWLLPLIGAGTALAFGVGVGLGVAHGARDVRRLTSGA
jgi:hypothetical protein